MDHDLLLFLSNIIGWLYVIFWGLVCYPQIILNYKLKSVEGFKLDFPFLNLTGFLFYSISFTVGYLKEDIAKAYGLGKIDLQDVAFAWHGVFVCIIFNIQSLIYPRGNNKISIFAICFTVFAWSSFITFYFCTEILPSTGVTASINYLKYAGYMKIGVSLIKYVPVAYWNFVRKSTQGFSVETFLFDFAGGSFSLMQAFLDFYLGETDHLNPVKVTLGVVCMSYDLLLIFQHFVLYGNRNKPKSISDETPYRGSIRDSLREQLVNHKDTEIIEKC